MVFDKLLKACQRNVLRNSTFQAYASRGYITVAIDSRYHGERAKNRTTYEDVSIKNYFMCYLFALCCFPLLYRISVAVLDF